MTDAVPDPNTEPPPPVEGDEPEGLARVRQLVAGGREVPGMWSTIGMRLVEVDLGRAVVEVVPGRRHANGSGIAHGGLAATILDSACGAAMASTLPSRHRGATVDLQVNYHRPVALFTDRLRGEGTITRAGRTVTHATGRLTDGTGRLLATCRAVFSIRAY